MDSQSSLALFDSAVPYLPLGRHSSFQLQHVAVTAESAIVTIGRHRTAPDCVTRTVPDRPFVARDIAELPNLRRWREAGRTIPWAATSTSHSASERSVLGPGRSSRAVPAASSPPTLDLRPAHETIGGGGERLPRHLDGPVRLSDLTAAHHRVSEHVEACDGCALPPWIWPGITTPVKGRRLRSVGIRTLTNSQRQAVG